MKETPILKSIQVALSNIGARMFRNNIGCLQDKQGRWITYGIANPGGSDLIGWYPITVTQAMVGRKLAIITCIEVKGDKGKPSDEQIAFIKTVQESGGIAFIARSEQGAVDGVKGMVGML